MLPRNFIRYLGFKIVLFGLLLSGLIPAHAALRPEQAKQIQRNFSKGTKAKTYTTHDNAVIEKFRESKTPGLFGAVKKIQEITETGQNSEASDPIMKEVQASTISYFAEFEKQKNESSKPAKKYPLLIEKSKFLGQPIIAKIKTLSDANDEVDFYLAVMHFNIPTVNPAASQFKYAFARFATKFVLYDEDPTEAIVKAASAKPQKGGGENNDSKISLEEAQRAKTLWPVKVIAVYPVNETLGVDRTDGSKLTVQAKPEWAGASGLSATQEWSKEEKYKMGLPTIVSTATKYGDAAWIFYPARAQPLMLGTKTTLALISVPKEATTQNFNLRVQCTLDYQLKFFKVIPGFQKRLQEPAFAPLLSAVTVEQLCQTHAVDIPDQMLTLIKTTMTTSDKQDLALTEKKARGGSDYVIDKKSGKLYRINGAQLTPLVRP